MKENLDKLFVELSLFCKYSMARKGLSSYVVDILEMQGL